MSIQVIYTLLLVVFTSIVNTAMQENFHGVDHQVREKVAVAGFHQAAQEDDLHPQLQNSRLLQSGNDQIAIKRSVDTPWSFTRKRREIFGPDQRSAIPPKQAGTKFPFNTTVKIWSPRVHCSGVLITPWHVLTAAHCIHDGQTLLASISAIQVASLQKNGKLTYSSVISFFIPPQWTSGKDNNSENDYAILRISNPLYGNVMKMRPVKMNMGTPIQFASFPEDKPYGSVWFVRCDVTKLFKDTRAYCKCDAFSGSSGAGIYVEPPFLGVKEPTIVGVLSNAWTLMYGWKPVQSANVITRINQEHFQAIQNFMVRTRGV